RRLDPTPRTVIERTRADSPMAAPPAAGTADRSRPVGRQQECLAYEPAAPARSSGLLGLVARIDGGPPRPARPPRRREAERGRIDLWPASTFDLPAHQGQHDAPGQGSRRQGGPGTLAAAACGDAGDADRAGP